MRTRWFYGWFIVLVASVGNFMATGTSFYIFNAFMLPLCTERGFSRTAVNAGPLIGSLLGLVTPMVYGFLLQKVGVRRIMVVGPVVAGVAFTALGQVRELWQFYLFYILLGLGNAGMSGMVVNAAISNWFVKKRGQAMGLATAASSFSGVVLPYLALILLSRLPLSWAFGIIGFLSLLVSPAAAFLVRERPENYGLLPDGEKEEKRDRYLSAAPSQLDSFRDLKKAEGKKQAPVWTLSLLLRTGAFWKMGSAYALVMMGVVGVMFQLAPRFTDLGFSKKTAMALMASTALLGTIGKYVWGVLCDRMDSRKVGAVLMALVTLGLLFALLPPRLPFIIPFILIFGFAMGGAMSTFPIMIADLFGRDSFAVAASYLYILLSLQGLGYIIMGISFDHTGSYNTAYLIFLLLSALATALVSSIRRPSLPLSSP